MQRWESLHISVPITVKTMSCFEDNWLWRGYNFWSATLSIGTFFLPCSQLHPTPKRLGMPRGLTLHLTTSAYKEPVTTCSHTCLENLVQSL